MMTTTKHAKKVVPLANRILLEGCVLAARPFDAFLRRTNDAKGEEEDNDDDGMALAVVLKVLSSATSI